jgi:hypothetical protein
MHRLVRDLGIKPRAQSTSQVRRGKANNSSLLPTAKSRSSEKKVKRKPSVASQGPCVAPTSLAALDLDNPTLLSAHQDPVYGYTNPDFDITAELNIVRRETAEGWTQSTTKLENGHLKKYWTPFCEERGLRLWRDDHDANSGRNKDGYQRECDILSAFLLYVMRHIKPKSKRPAALPSSSMNVVRSIRRIAAKRAPAITMVPIKAVQPVLRAATRKYMRKYSWRTLLPKRREPWRRHHLKKIFGFRDRIGVNLGGFQVSKSPLWYSMFAFLETSVQSGMRASESLVQSGGQWHPADHISRASLLWCIGGKIYEAPTAAQLRAITESDYAILLPPPSKTDSFGVIWGDKPIYLPVRFNAPWCAALRFRDLELNVPVDTVQDRAQLPLYVDDDGSPLTYATASKILSAMKDLVMVDGEDKSLFTFHSFRVTLATQLGNSGARDPLIQSMCRWQTQASLRIYNRMQPEQACGLLDKAMAAKITGYTAANLPTISTQDLVAGINAFNQR